MGLVIFSHDMTTQFRGNLFLIKLELEESTNYPTLQLKVKFVLDIRKNGFFQNHCGHVIKMRLKRLISFSHMNFYSLLHKVVFFQ